MELDLTMFQEINNHTQKGLHYLKEYLNSPYKNLFDCYKRPSLTKMAIFEKIDNFRKDVNGFGMKILSYNCNFFSCAFRCYCNDKVYLIVYTPMYQYCILYA